MRTLSTKSIFHFISPDQQAPGFQEHESAMKQSCYPSILYQTQQMDRKSAAIHTKPSLKSHTKPTGSAGFNLRHHQQENTVNMPGNPPEQPQQTAYFLKKNSNITQLSRKK
jgi:hypothetical protein